MARDKKPDPGPIYPYPGGPFGPYNNPPSGPMRPPGEKPPYFGVQNKEAEQIKGGNKKKGTGDVYGDVYLARTPRYEPFTGQTGYNFYRVPNPQNGGQVAWGGPKPATPQPTPPANLSEIEKRYMKNNGKKR